MTYFLILVQKLTHLHVNAYLLEQFNVPLPLELVHFAQRESSSDCALRLFRCLLIFNITPFLARPADLIQTIKPFNQCHSNVTEREVGHVPALPHVLTLVPFQFYLCNCLRTPTAGTPWYHINLVR